MEYAGVRRNALGVSVSPVEVAIMTLAFAGKSRRRRAILTLAAALTAAAGLVGALYGSSETTRATHVSPTPIADLNGDNNPTCSDFNSSWTEFKINAAPTNGQFTDGTLVITISNAGVKVNGRYEFDWSSNIGVDAVFVKQANDQHNLYVYSPPATSDTGLGPQFGPNQGGISHVSFCYNPNDDTPTPTATTPANTPTEPVATATQVIEGDTPTPTTPSNTATPTTPVEDPTATPTTPANTPTTPANTPTTPGNTPTTPPDPTNTQPGPTNTQPAPTNTPVPTEIVAGAKTPAPPVSGSGFISGGGGGFNLALLVLGLLTVSAACGFLASGRRKG